MGAPIWFSWAQWHSIFNPQGSMYVRLSTLGPFPEMKTRGKNIRGFFIIFGLRFLFFIFGRTEETGLGGQGSESFSQFFRRNKKPMTKNGTKSE